MPLVKHGWRRAQCLLPEPVYFRLKALALFNKRSLSHYLTLGAKHILAHHSDVARWPKEYWDDFREVQARSAGHVNRTDGRLPSLISKENATEEGTNEASIPLARVEKPKKSGSAEG